MGTNGEPLFDRCVDELIFRAAIWVSRTQMVRFSDGANEMIDRDAEFVEREKPNTKVIPNPDFHPRIPWSPGFGHFPVRVRKSVLVDRWRCQSNRRRRTDIRRS